MTEDIKKRLRDFEKTGDYVDDGLLDKAADYIEELEAEVERLERLLSYHEGPEL